ncbi:MAG: DUF6789 family protein [Pseudolabrys sp.]
MVVKGWIWKSAVAGLCGTLVHFCFMYLKSRAGLLPAFQPYQSLQHSLSQWVGADVPTFVPWLFSFVNGMAILGFLFARINRLLPGRNGISKGAIFGLIGWVLMGVIFFPLIGLGPFAFQAGLGIAPALLSLGMLLTYSIVLATVYAALDRWSEEA